uniref:Uncharacterized protein n=1 Tax=Solanum tuberosum TaxID=4113 RepID=M1DVD4_SOLTU
MVRRLAEWIGESVCNRFSVFMFEFSPNLSRSLADMGVDDEEAPKTSGIPPATTGDVQRSGTTYEESDAETDEELIVVHEEEMMERREHNIFRDLLDLVGMIVQPVIQTSLTETSTTTPSEFGTAIPSEVTPGTDRQVHTATPGTETPTD